MKNGPVRHERPMKWYFALNAASIEIDKMYERCVEVAVLSALQHTSLQPHFIFDGEPCPLTNRLARMGATIIFHKSSLSDAILASTPNEPAWKQIAHGAFLRIDLPDIDCDSEFVLYTDCDVMFQREPNLDGIKPKFFAVAPEFAIGDYKNMNTGVMVMNLPGMRGVARQLRDFIEAGIPSFPTYDQAALREFFDGRYEPLPERLNWKPYWGYDPNAEIFHFHGPKPPHVRVMLADHSAGYPQILWDLFNANRATYTILDSLWHAYAARASRM